MSQGSRHNFGGLLNRLTERDKPKIPKNLIQTFYPVYNSITWEEVKACLLEFFPPSEYPDLEFPEDRVHLGTQDSVVLVEADRLFRNMSAGGSLSRVNSIRQAPRIR